MTLYSDWQIDRAEAYQILSVFFLRAPDEEALQAIRLDFNIDATEESYVIAEDFDRLFSVPHGNLQPFESLYAGMADGSYKDVSIFYAETGLMIGEDFEVAPDHLAVELLFMSYLVENNKTDLELKFLEQHLMNWVPDFCDTVTEAAKTEFYRKIAAVIKDFLTTEYEEYTE